MSSLPPDEHARPGAEGVYEALSRRLGVAADAACIEGPRRHPLAGPSDEPPLDRLLRLSSHIDELAEEIARMPSRTYRAQLWQQWATVFRRRPEVQAWLARTGEARGDMSSGD